MFFDKIIRAITVDNTALYAGLEYEKERNLVRSLIQIRGTAKHLIRKQVGLKVTPL